jgi:SAM-dependent methyltransferase
MATFFPWQFYRLQAAGYSLFARITRKRCFGYGTVRAYLQGKSGLEFGGPSSIFTENRLIPIYDIVRAIDSCNFAQQTIWTVGQDHRRFGSQIGRQFIGEACDVSEIADDSYDFVAASHVLEHVANPLRALQEWKRLLKPSGTILVVVPHRAGTFDHRRPFTSFDHIKGDFESNVTEADLTHLQEVLELSDLALDPPAGSPQQFRERCLQNLSKRAMHHHVFSPELLVEMFSFLQMRILNIAVERPYHIIVHATKMSQDGETGVHQENAAFLKAAADWRSYDPFRASEGAQE